MMKLKKISIIIPTRNEKDNVGKLSEMIYDVLKGIPYNIVFVDDSTDDTWECIEELRQEHPEYNIGGEHRNNGDGLAGAVIRGFSIADEIIMRLWIRICSIRRNASHGFLKNLTRDFRSLPWCGPKTGPPDW